MGADRVFELARHLTWRDREIALYLYDHQVLNTGQLQLLFFSSKRRCQDRLLFLYRHRVLDRFYPPGPFGAGKPQAHWLLDEAGAILVAASMGVEPKQLGWSRRDDWGSHRQLAHRLEANQFVCELIAATLPDTRIGVTAWESTRHAAERLDDRRLVRPDASLILDVPAGPIECFLEWDRATETQARLAEKIERYRVAEAKLRDETQMLGVFAEFEHATIVDRITAGIERRAKEGRWYSGRPPFGYNLHDGQLAADPITAPVVRRIYRLYTEDRLGTIAIAHQLRAEHAPAPSAGWGHPAVHRVLTNPTHLGRIRWRDQDFESTHEPLIDQDTFDRARVILAERGEDASRRRGNRSDFLLSGVIRCGHCGRAYIGMSAHGKGGTYHYYACTARQKYGPKACAGQRIPRERSRPPSCGSSPASTATVNSYMRTRRGP